MEDLNNLLSKLPERQRAALQWFVDHAGQEHPWPKPLIRPDGEVLLASKAKGIYKPSWSPYALSIRQSLGGPYLDRDPIFRPDGTWLFSYYQENQDPLARDSQYTNRALVKAWRDKVPVGVLRQINNRLRNCYLVLGVALVAGWDAGYFFFEGFAVDGHAHAQGPGGEIELITKSQELVKENLEEYVANMAIDNRERTIAQIVKRRGQLDFRNKLLETYNYRCAISECDAVDALEAVHILPYRGEMTNHVSNGLLLRADLHTLFDLGLIAIHPSDYMVMLAPKLMNSAYHDLAGRPIRLPPKWENRPSDQALEWHWIWSGL